MQFRGGLETAIAERLHEWQVDRTRHMARHRVDGLHLATEAFGGTRIEQPARVLVQPLRDLIGADEVARLEARRVGRHRRWHRTRAGLFATDGPPCGQAAIEHRHARMAEQLQQPPGAGGRHAAVARVVDDHLVRRPDAPFAQPAGEGLAVGQRMPPFADLRQVRQVSIEIGVHRAGDMAFGVGRAAGVGGRVEHHEPGIHHPQCRVAQGTCQVGRFDEGGPVHALRSSRSRRLNRMAAVAPQMRCPGQPYSSTTRRRPR